MTGFKSVCNMIAAVCFSGALGTLSAGEFRTENIGMKWQSSQAAAIQAARSSKLPVMIAIARKEDQKLVDKLGSWPQSIEMTTKDKLIAAQVKAESAEGTELLTKLAQRAPAVIFVDHNGNAMLGMPLPESVQPITAVVSGWPTLLTNIDKFMKDHVTRGEKYMDKGKLKDAYLEFSYGAPFKGTDAEKAKGAQVKIEELWGKLLETALKMPDNSVARTAITKGLLRETFGTSFYAEMETAIKAGKPLELRSTGAAYAAKVAPAKSLAEVARSAPSIVSASRAESEDGPVDSKFLINSTNPKLKEAEKLLQDGITDYKKATADSMERGAARNELLKSAHSKFDKTLTLFEEASKTIPDPQIEKLMEKTSMLMYGTLKYQSL
jgi:hypothetical protein